MHPSQVMIDGIQGTIQQDGMIKFGADTQLNVQFYKRSVLNQAKSIQMGCPFNEDIDYVRIQHPGERDVRDMPVTDDPGVIQRFAGHWMRYQQNLKQAPSGTPVECLFPSQPAIAANLHGMGVHTVQQLANLTAEGLQQVGMGAMQWHTLAKDFIKSAKEGVGHHHLQKELADRDNKIEVLTNQLSQMQKQMEVLMAKEQGVPNAMLPRRSLAAVPQMPPPLELPPSAFNEPVDPEVEAAVAAAVFAPLKPITNIQLVEKRKPGRPRKTA